MPAPGHNIPQRMTDRIETRRAEDMTGKPVIKSNPIHRATMKWVTSKILPYLINWKTTLVGVGMVAGGIGGLADHLASVAEGKPLTLESIQLQFAAIAAGVGLIMARDANISSKESGVKP